MADTLEEAAQGKPLTRVTRACAAVVPLVIGLACAALLSSQVEGKDAALSAAVFSLGLACVGFVISLFTYFLLSSTSRWRITLVVVWVVGLIGITAFLVLPQAPTGSDHPEVVPDGTRTLQRDVEAFLDGAVPGLWSLEYHSKPLACRDWLGRQRGAMFSEFKFGVKPVMTMDDLDQLSDGLRQAGWEVESSQSTLSGQTDRYIHATRLGYQINAHATSGATYTSDGNGAVYASTPCLRA